MTSVLVNVVEMKMSRQYEIVQYVDHKTVMTHTRHDTIEQAKRAWDKGFCSVNPAYRLFLRVYNFERRIVMEQTIAGYNCE